MVLCCGAPASAQSGVSSPHDPPQPKEEGAGRSWAEKYADRKRHWCFQPVADPPVPAVADGSWPRTAIDRFILAKLDAAKLKPAPQAAPEVLARRLSFALTGLPPKPENASLPFEALVDRLLASPQFGEHWARHWMDVVRYAETYGSEHDYLNPHAWRYRDYLVRAFNEDLPYDRFVQEQIAGDLLASPRINRALGINESLLGTAFQRMSEFYATPVDVMREQASVIDWQIENVSKAFLGLTIACARCHDHKFDPISTADFYALYGVFTGARPTVNIVDDPARLTLHDRQLATLKDEIRRALVERWLQTDIDAKALKDAMAKAKDKTAFAQLRSPSPPAIAPDSGAPPTDVVPAVEHWHASGPGLPGKSSSAGTLSLHAGGPSLVRAILPSGYYSDAISDRHGGSLRSPEFTLSKRHVSVLAGGAAKARLRLVVEGCQGDIVLFDPANEDLADPMPRWITLRLRDQWIGLRGHLEIMTLTELPTVGNVKDVQKWEKGQVHSAFGIVRAVLHDDGAGPPAPPALPRELWQEKSESAEPFATLFNKVLRQAVIAWRDGALTDPQACLLQASLQAGLLPNDVPAGTPLAARVSAFRDLEKRIPPATRAPGVQHDGSSRDVPVFVRGDHLTPGEMVPRRMPDILGGRPLNDREGGDRLALARELTRHDNPLAARVMVNRVWHHLFGRGLVGSTDNFGRTGDRPSHPELLDHLATQFMREGWSVKQLIREIVTSRAWQTVAQASPESTRSDPTNLLLSHAHSRRLQAESIRDSMLAVAGNLSLATGGPSVYNHYREAVDPDKQPPSGPLDGQGRRSLYLEVRRNFLSEFLTTFDFPRPNNPTGRRSETNVPAQGITLLNDPFVLHQAELWGQRISSAPGSDESRVQRMHREAFGREASPGEVSRSLEFLREGNSWADLAHVMFNQKEFIYLP